MKRAAAGILCAALALTAAGARADPPASEHQRVEWSPEWRRFRAWEYVGTAAVQTTSLYIRWYRPPPTRAYFQGRNVFDDTIRGWLHADTPEGRALAGTVSDWTAQVGTAFPFAVDLQVALIGHRNLDVAWQLLMMDLEATAVANFVNNLLFYKAGRGRPSTPDCAVDPSYDPICGGIGNNASLPSGHTVTIATATGLTCIHHWYLPLYADPRADAGACIVLSLATLTTGVTRIIADRHYTTDVLLGAGIGLASGIGLPWLLHYRTRAGERAGAETALTVVPFAIPAGAGVGVFGFL